MKKVTYGSIKVSTSKFQNWNRDAELMRVQGEFSLTL